MEYFNEGELQPYKIKEEILNDKFQMCNSEVEAGCSLAVKTLSQLGSDVPTTLVDGGHNLRVGHLRHSLLHERCRWRCD